ncbi:MAG: hypothetical protein OXC62_05365, partial [Aestuariivita sp.]|nr:hypothetical protein [Aestuariivita sp.]
MPGPLSRRRSGTCRPRGICLTGCMRTRPFAVRAGGPDGRRYHVSQPGEATFSRAFAEFADSEF